MLSRNTPDWVPVLDPGRVQALRELASRWKPGTLAELFDTYVEDGRRRLALIAGGMEAADRESVRYEAHALKGSSLTIGASAMAVLCAACEAAATAGNQAIMPAFRDLENAFAAAAEALSSALIGNGEPGLPRLADGNPPRSNP